MDRKEAITRIRTALKAKTGKTWSVTGGRGTSWGWITVQALPKRRVLYQEKPDGEWDWDTPWRDRVVEVEPGEGEKGEYTSFADTDTLAKAFGRDRPVHCQGLSISSDNWELYVRRAEG